MSQQELLKKVVETLDNLGIEYMVTGSVVSSLQGEPRSTHDIDLVVVIAESVIEKLVEAFPHPDFYLDEDSIRDAIVRRSMFNLLAVTAGDKVDFWLLTDDPFDQARFSRKYLEEFQGMQIQCSSPEDTILAKLKWAKLSGGSEKQFTDALRVYEVQKEKLDANYVEIWAKRLEIDTLWQKLKEEAEPV